MAMSIPPHYSHTNVATVDGTGAGRLHVDTEFTSVTSPSQISRVRLPVGYTGLRIEGYVGDNGFTLIGANSINGMSGFPIPPNYYFSATKIAADTWVVSLVDNLGNGESPFELRSAINNLVLTSAINGQSLTSARSV